MRISDWSSDVCSADLAAAVAHRNDSGCAQARRRPQAGDRVRTAGGLNAAMARPSVHGERAWPRQFQLPMSAPSPSPPAAPSAPIEKMSKAPRSPGWRRSEEHTSELQSLMRISYAVFCFKKKNTTHLIDYS